MEKWEELTLNEKLDLVIRSIEFELADNEANGTPSEMIGPLEEVVGVIDQRYEEM